MIRYKVNRDNTANYDGFKMPANVGLSCKILGVELVEGKTNDAGVKYSDRLEIKVDVVTGEYAGFYQKQYDASTNEDKRYKGVLKLYIPTEDGSERDEWTQKQFNSAIVAIEESNTGYTFDGDEKKLVGKLIGIITGPVRTIIDGRAIEYSELAARGVRSTIELNRGNWKKLRVRYAGCTAEEWSGSSSAPQRPSGSGDDFVVVSGDEEEIPF